MGLELLEIHRRSFLSRPGLGTALPQKFQSLFKPTEWDKKGTTIRKGPRATIRKEQKFILSLKPTERDKTATTIRTTIRKEQLSENKTKKRHFFVLFCLVCLSSCRRSGRSAIYRFQAFRRSGTFYRFVPVLCLCSLQLSFETKRACLENVGENRAFHPTCTVYDEYHSLKSWKV